MAGREGQMQTRCRSARCRSCRHEGLLPVLDLGSMPLADELLSEQQRHETQARYPLEVAFCPDCSLVQIIETVPPEVVFGADYPYYSSFSEALLEHSRRNALELIESRRLGQSSLVIEIASNDGYLLKNFVERGVPVLGIDPAPGPAEAARQKGVPTLCEFFGVSLADRLAAEGSKADVVIANNVLAHVADTNGLVAAMRTVLADDGVVVIEVPYVRELVDGCEFDTIYHEHLCYFSVTSADRLFRRNGLFLNDIRRLPIHGGSLRFYIQAVENVGAAVREMLAAEAEAGIDRHDYYEGFGQRVKDIRRQLRRLLGELKAGGNRIAAYGAAAKGAILLNYAGIGPETIDFVADRNVHKQGKYMPGRRIPICDPRRLEQEMPDYTLLLAWNFTDEIVRQQTRYLQMGGKFVIPIPTPRVLDSTASAPG